MNQGNETNNTVNQIIPESRKWNKWYPNSNSVWIKEMKRIIP